MSGRPVLVTGGAGFLGAALVRRLVERGDRVRVLDDASRGSFARLTDLDGRYEQCPADVRDEAAVRRAVEGCDVVHHLAAVNGTRNFYERPRLVLDVAVRGILAVVNACVDAGVPRLLIASSSEVYHDPPAVPTAEDAPLRLPDPYNPRFSYSGGKILSELVGIHYTRDTPTGCVIFRPHNVYGPAMGYEHVIPNFVGKLRCAVGANPRTRGWAAMTGAEVVARAGGSEMPAVPMAIEGDGSQTRAFCFIDDAVEALLVLADRAEAGRTYNVGRAVETTIAELAETLGRVVGLRVEPAAGGAPAGGPQRRCPDTARLDELGFRASTDLEEGLRRTVPFYWDHPGA